MASKVIRYIYYSIKVVKEVFKDTVLIIYENKDKLTCIKRIGGVVKIDLLDFVKVIKETPNGCCDI